MSAQQVAPWCGNEFLPSPPPTAIDPNYSPMCAVDDVKYIRVNYHFVGEDDGSGNFTPDNDGGLNYTSKNGYEFAEDIINRANEHLANNPISWLWHPDRGNIPATVRYRLVLKGVHFHRNTIAYWEEDFYNYSFEVNNFVDENTIQNIFDSNLKGTDGIGPSGVGPFGNKFCLVDNYDAYKKIVNPIYPLQYNDGANPDTYDVLDAAARTLLHELGHNFELRHSWSGDWCTDTPNHINCPRSFNSVTKPNIINDPDYDSNCDVGTNPSADISNNLMDYNLYYPGALTPCQADTLNYFLNSIPLRNSQTVACDICPDAENSALTPAAAFFTTNKDIYGQNDIVVWGGGNTDYKVILNGFGSFNETEYELEICKTGNYFSNNQNCVNQNYTTNIISGSIQISNLYQSYNFYQNSTYKITLTVNNTNCPFNDSFTKFIKIRKNYQPPQPDCRIGNLKKRGDDIKTAFEIFNSSNTEIIAIQLTGAKNTYEINEGGFYEEGNHTLQFNTSNFENGIYRLVIIPQLGGTACYRSFLKFGN